MSKFLLSAMLILASVGAYAAQLTATLQSGSALTPFYGETALQDALDASKDGDVITLSPGTFRSVDIQKQVSIVGSYAFSEDSFTEATNIQGVRIYSDNVVVEGVRTDNDMTLYGASNVEVTRCYAKIFRSWSYMENTYCDNTIVRDCIFREVHMDKFTNAYFSNCGIGRFKTSNEKAYPALIENCNIALFSAIAGTSTVDTSCQAYAIYRNCFLGLYNYTGTYGNAKLTLSSPSEFHDCLFVHEDKHSGMVNKYELTFQCPVENCVEWVMAAASHYDSEREVPTYESHEPYVYNDISYGPSNPKYRPSIPEVVASEIDNHTDDEGAINVKITAVAHD